MSSNFEVLTGLLEHVARALGEALLPEVVFVGGCTTGLLLTDDLVLEDVRLTNDVDIIVEVASHRAWRELQALLQQKGFRVVMDEEVICRMRLGGLAVDFMPTSEDVLGFTNPWYESAMQHAVRRELAEGLIIQCVDGPHFIGTKLAAYRGRGNDDPIASHDLEDIFVLLDGRSEVVTEVAESATALKEYIAEVMCSLLKHRDFELALAGSVLDTGRREQVRGKMMELASN